MNDSKTFRINWFVGTLFLLSTGVLVGCEYCSPLLLATIVGAIVYHFTKHVHEAMQIKPFTN